MLNSETLNQLPTLKDIISYRPATLDREVRLAEALKLMQQQGDSAVVICEQARPVGIITERDIVRLLQAQAEIAALRVGDVMQLPVRVCRQDESMVNAYLLMRDQTIRHLAVMDDAGQFLGIVDEGSFLRHLPERHFLAPRTVTDVMSRQLITVRHDRPLAEVVALLAERCISCAVVTREQAVVGMLTERDVVRLVLSGVDLAATPVAAQMTSPVRCIAAAATLLEAEQQMRAQGVRRFVVTDGNETVGLVTEHDLVKGIPTLYTQLLQLALQERDTQLARCRALEKVIGALQDEAVLVADGRGRVEYVSELMRHWCRLPADLVGQSIFRYAGHPALTLLDAPDLSERLARGESSRCDTTLAMDGAQFHFECTLIPQPAPDTGFIVLLRDMTERIRAYRLLSDEHKLFAQGPVVMFRWRNEPGWPVEFVSDNVEEVIGHPPEAFYSGAICYADCIHPADKPRVLDEVATASAEPVDNFAHEPYRILRPDGQVFWLYDKTVILRDKAGTPTHFLGYVIEMTRQVETARALDDERRRFQTVLDNAPIGIWLLGADQRLQFVNKTFCRTTGISEEAYRAASHYGELLAPEAAARCMASDRACLAQEEPHLSLEELPVDGRLHTLEITKVKLRDAEGRVQGLIGLAQDVTAQQKAALWQRQTAAVFESTREGVILTSVQGNIIAVNKAFCDITGYGEAEVLGRNPSLLQSGRYGPAFYRTLWRSIHSHGSWQGEIWNRRKSGAIYPEWLTISAVRDADAELLGYVGVFSDITQIKESQQEMEFLAHHDPLTQLPNRLLFGDRLGHAMKRAARDGSRLALLFLDLDNFKHVNDSLGHEVGDRLLQEVAGRLQQHLRAEDTVARLGGDEFAILIEQLEDAEEAARIADKLLQVVNRSFSAGEVELFVGGSIGISIFPDDGDTATTLLRNADAAMYRAKAAGRSTYQFYAAEMTANAFEHVVIEGQLRRAIEQDELLLCYQPQIDLASGRVAGVEALVRWRHPEIGIVSPARFIPIAEQTDLIVRLGEWVLREACRQGRAWLDAGIDPGLIAVNISGAQLQRDNLLASVQRVLEETGLPPRKLELEITESFVMGHEGKAIELLQAIRNLGINLAIDDFGTGYSSLAYLKKLPIQKLKIDQSFVRELPLHEEDAAIASAIVALGQSLDFTVIAEGVENRVQSAYLKNIGCDQGQGFLYSRPLPAEELARWFRAWQGQR